MQFLLVVALIFGHSFCWARQRQQFRERPSNVTVAQGNDVLLRCVVDEAKLGNTHWTKDALYLGSGNTFEAYPRYRLIGDHFLGEYHFSINNVTLEDDSQYECQVLPAPGEEKSLMAIAHVNVLVPPSEVSLDGARYGARIEAKADSVLDVLCRANGAKPAAHLVWYRNDRRVPEDFFKNQAIPEDDKRFSTVSRLRLIVSAQDNGAVFTCEAAHPAINVMRPVRTQFTLSVIYPPGPPVITGYNAGRTVMAGDLIVLRCMVENGNPLPEVIWYRNSVSVGRNFSATHKYTVNEYSLIAQPPDDEAEFRCEATNLAAVSPISSSIRLKVYYAPERVEISGLDQAKLGDTIRFNCTSSASQPEAKLLWMVDGEIFSGHSQRNWQVSIAADGSGIGTRSSSFITFKIANRRPEMTITCIAVNEQLPTPKRETVAMKIVRISYPPESAKIVIDGGDKPLVSGEKISLSCVVAGGHPPATVEWFKNERRLPITGTPKYDSTRNITISQSSFVLTPQDNMEQVQCRAYNWASELSRVSDSITLRVHFAPDFVKISPVQPEFLVDKPSHLICESGSAYPSPTVEWFRNGEQIGSVVIQNKTGSNGGWVIKKDLPLSPAVQDNGAVYECRAGSSVDSTKVVSQKVTLKVNYKPIYLAPIHQTLEILEGESITLNCSAYSNPPVDAYLWQKEKATLRSTAPRILINGAILEIMNIQRNDAGVYTCKAKNRVGASTLTATILVKHPATIQRISPTTYVNFGENVSLLCEVSGHPLGSGVIRWMRPGGQESNDGRFGEGSGVLTINGVRREDTGMYRCIANNGIGLDDVKETMLLVRQAPSLDHSSIYTRAAAPLGQTAELTCVADAIPEVKFTWHRESNSSHSVSTALASPLVYDTDRVSVSNEHIGLMRYKSYMIIQNVQDSDYGVYRCTAENELGSPSLEIRFGRPEAPEEPLDLRVLNKTHDSVTLAWRAGFTGGLPVQFHITYQTSGTGKKKGNEKPRVIQTTSTMVMVDGLKPQNMYTFSIQTSNEIGSSDLQTINADTPGPASMVQEMAKEDLSGSVVLLVVLASLAGIILLVVNASLVVCFLRCRRRKKLEARAAAARLGNIGRKVQMYSSEGGSTATYRHNHTYSASMDDPQQRPRSAMSDGNESVRTVIEVENGHLRNGIIMDGESPSMQRGGYILDNISQDFEDTQSDAAYAATLRKNSLQRHLANGVYNVPRAAVHQINPEDGNENTYVPGQIVDDILPPVPSLSGPVRDTLNREYSYQKSTTTNKQPPRRYSPTHIAHSHGLGRTPYAEVRPLLSSIDQSDTIPGDRAGSPMRHGSSSNRLNTGSPILSTFATTMPLRTNLVDDDDEDSLAGDLV